MNKQELIDKLKKQLTAPSEIDDTGFNKFYDLAINYAIYLAEQLDEPKRPAVPRYVADLYESIKDDFEDGVYEICVQFYEDESESSTNLYRWFDRDDSKPIETLVKMKLFGYEVEKEKLYTAKLKLTNEYLGYESQLNGLLHYKVPDSSAKGATAFHFTEDDLVKYHIWGNDTYKVREVEDE